MIALITNIDVEKPMLSVGKWSTSMVDLYGFCRSATFTPGSPKASWKWMGPSIVSEQISSTHADQAWRVERTLFFYLSACCCWWCWCKYEMHTQQYMYIYIHIHVHINEYAGIYIYIYAHTCTYKWICMCLYICIYSFIYIHILQNIFMCFFFCVCVCLHMFVYVCLWVFACDVCVVVNTTPVFCATIPDGS